MEAIAGWLGVPQGPERNRVGGVGEEDLGDAGIGEGGEEAHLDLAWARAPVWTGAL